MTDLNFTSASSLKRRQASVKAPAVPAATYELIFFRLRAAWAGYFRVRKANQAIADYRT